MSKMKMDEPASKVEHTCTGIIEIPIMPYEFVVLAVTIVIASQRTRYIISPM
ncbi:MAG TPA: hypothetical protein VK638_30495 [Edaphobacter sp.]|nr:hypothetical protein [Edaphobacter sp.]